MQSSDNNAEIDGFEIYGNEFYENQINGSLRSAMVVLEELFKIYRPNSILDIGCGRGAWLAASKKLGAVELYGYDGPWVRKENLILHEINFENIDMEKDIPFRKRCDLAMSVEVAEHLSTVRADSIVDTLCKASDVVLFGAAIPLQGGVNHINEQRQSYWASKFYKRGYECYDALRPKIWNNENVMPWYRSNILVYVNEANKVDKLNSIRASGKPAIIDLVHPLMFENRVKSYRVTLHQPTLRFCASIISSYIKNVFKG